MLVTAAVFNDVTSILVRPLHWANMYEMLVAAEPKPEPKLVLART
jgi:hypothetical protein